MQHTATFLKRITPAPAIAVALVGLGCASGGGGEPERLHAFSAQYLVSCSVTDECRVTFIDQEGELRARDIVGEWRLDLGVDVGTRLWVRVSAGGCPPRPIRVEILFEGTTVAQRIERAEHRSRCDWLMVETEFRVP